MMPAATIAQADASELKVFTPGALNKVSLGSASQAELVNAVMMPTSDAKLLAFSIKYYNGGNSDLDLNNYWAKVRSKSKAGTAYSVKIAAGDRNKSKLPAKNETIITYYSELSEDATLGDVIIDVIEWDLYSSSGSFEKRLGQFSFAEQHFTVPAGFKYEMKQSGMALQAGIKKSSISSNEKYHNIALTVELLNSGKSTVALPQLKYYVLTKEDILYPLTPSRTTASEIAPKLSVELSLRANIPVEIKPDGWKLVVANATGDDQLALPLAAFAIPRSEIAIRDDFKAEYSFATLDGLYHVTINRITRAPIDDRDVLSAYMTIKNKGTKAVPVPELTGMFVLDDAIEIQASMHQPNKVIAISPNAEIDVYLHAAIPYTFEFEEMKLVLQEKDPVTNEVGSLLEVTGNNPVEPLPLLASDEAYNVTGIGARSTYAVREVRSYENNTSKRYTVQLDAKNLERRAINVQQMAGFIKTSDGNIFPTEVAEIKNKMTPGGKALIEIAAYMPLEYDLTDATLILGEVATAEGGQQTAETVYINPVEIRLPSEKAPQDTLENIDLYPYRLTISNVKSQIQYGSGTLTLDFKYKLERDSLVQFNGENKKIVIEVLDEKNNVAVANEYAIEAGDGSFIVGEHEFKFINNEDPDLIFKIERLNNTYKLNVYEQYGADYRKLLASKEIRWFATSD